MKKRLKRSEKEEILRIVGEENALENTRYGSPLDGDRYVVVPSETDPARLSAFAAAFDLGETVDGRPVTEIMLFTDPAERRKGIAAALLQKIRRTEEVLKFAEYASPSGDAFLHKAGAVHAYDELCMTLSLPDLYRERQENGEMSMTSSAEEDAVREEVVGEPEDASRRFFSKRSELYVNRDGDAAYIFGVRTDRAHMQKGHAKRLLSAVIAKLSSEGVKEAVLQVSGENEPALRLYETMGFAVSERLGMWYLT